MIFLIFLQSGHTRLMFVFPVILRVRVLDQTDHALIMELEKGLPFNEEPFEELGERLGIDGEEVIVRICRLQDDGFIRKIRARINQRQIGIMANALVAWHVPSDWDGYNELATQDGVTHCYLRRSIPGKWDYNVYTVHHRRNREEVHEEVKKISERISVSEYIVLFSLEEFKRVPAVRMNEIGGYNL